MLLSGDMEENTEECHISEEEIQAFQARSSQVGAKRLQLREELKNRYGHLCTGFGLRLIRQTWWSSG